MEGNKKYVQNTVVLFISIGSVSRKLCLLFSKLSISLYAKEITLQNGVLGADFQKAVKIWKIWILNIRENPLWFQTVTKL